MLRDHDRLSRPTREQKCRDVGRIERVVQQHDVGVSDFPSNGAERSEPGDRKRYSERAFGRIACPDRNRARPCLQRSSRRVTRKPGDALPGSAKFARELADDDFDAPPVAIEVCGDHEELHVRLKQMIGPDPGIALPKGVRRSAIHWVRPEIVVEIRFAEWTRDGILRHSSGAGEPSTLEGRATPGSTCRRGELRLCSKREIVGRM